MKWEDSIFCKSKLFCRDCKSRTPAFINHYSVKLGYEIPTACSAVPMAIQQTLQAEQVSASHLSICKECDNYNGNLCEIAFPKGCCSCTWGKFLNGGICPNGLWGTERDLGSRLS